MAIELKVGQRLTRMVTNENVPMQVEIVGFEDDVIKVTLPKIAEQGEVPDGWVWTFHRHLFYEIDERFGWGVPKVDAVTGNVTIPTGSVLLFNRDLYGRAWSLEESELCGGCGQPDNTGDCDHTRLSDEQVEELGGWNDPLGSV